MKSGDKLARVTGRVKKERKKVYMLFSVGPFLYQQVIGKDKRQCHHTPSFYFKTLNFNPEQMLLKVLEIKSSKRKLSQFLASSCYCRSR